MSSPKSRRGNHLSVVQPARREFLRGVAALGLAGLLPAGRVFADTAKRHDELAVSLRAQPSTLSLRPGAATPVLRFHGKVLQGAAGAVQALPDNAALGPVLRVRRGQRLRVRFTNGLTQPSIIHWHGLHVPDDMDGHPRFAVPAGGQYDYRFTVANRAGTYWYHPHAHGNTGTQIYHGLAGALLIEDDEERALGLPSGEQDIPLVLQDRTLDADNRLRYLGGGMMERMMGVLGEAVWVNGRSDFSLSVAARPYRLRLVNASNARIYKLGWSDGTPLTVIATDGGLLARPVERPYVMLAPGERVELWADFARYRQGTELALNSLPFSGTMMMDGMMGGGGMMGGMMRGGMMQGMSAAPPNGAPLPLMTVRVARPGNTSRPRLPTRLARLDAPRPEAARNAAAPRRIRLTMGMMQWGLNGRTFDMNAVADDEVVQLGSTEVWEFVNDGAGMMGMMAHPMHVHGAPFRVLERMIARPQAQGYASVREGFVDEGDKDTVLVMPGERVRVLIPFRDYPGLFVYHCHNLEHADDGMMRNYRVRA